MRPPGTKIGMRKKGVTVIYFLQRAIVRALPVDYFSPTSGFWIFVGLLPNFPKALQCKQRCTHFYHVREASEVSVQNTNTSKNPPGSTAHAIFSSHTSKRTKTPSDSYLSKNAPIFLRLFTSYVQNRYRTASHNATTRSLRTI